MTITFDKRDKRGVELGVIVGILALLGIVLARYAHSYFTLLPPCMFHTITGVPCPSCGATRSATLLAHGEVVRALAMNPFFFFLFIAAVIWGIGSLILFTLKFTMSVRLSYLEARIIRWGVLIMLFANWCYLIVAEGVGWIDI